MLGSGQRAPHVQWEPLKLSTQATGLKGTANQKSFSKAKRRALALAKERVHKSIGASQSLGKVKQSLRDIQGEIMKRLESEHSYLKGGKNTHTLSEMDEQDEEPR